MSRIVAIGLALGLSVSATGAIAQDGNAMRQLGEGAIRDLLLDPYSAVIEWSPEGFVPVNGITQGKWIFKRPLVSGPAILGCGMVNAKNRMGGYTGRVAFEVAFQNGVVVMADVDGAGNDDVPVALPFCRSMGFSMGHGPVSGPASPAAAPTPVPTPFATAAPGHVVLGVRGAKLPASMVGPIGAPSAGCVIVVAIEPNSVAARAGLAVGDCIVRLGERTIIDTPDMISAIGTVAPGQLLDAQVVRGARATEISLHF